MTAKPETGVRIVATTDSVVNLSSPPIVCAIYTDRPLPPAAWEYVGRLAKAVHDCADRIGDLS